MKMSIVPRALIQCTETEAERKARLDALFLAELGGPPPPKPVAMLSGAAAKPSPAAGASTAAAALNTATQAAKPSAAKSEPSRLVNVTRTYQFAGADIKCVMQWSFRWVLVQRGS